MQPRPDVVARLGASTSPCDHAARSQIPWPRSNPRRCRLPQRLTTTPVSALPRPKRSRCGSRWSRRWAPTSSWTSRSGRSPVGPREPERPADRDRSSAAGANRLRGVTWDQSRIFALVRSSERPNIRRDLRSPDARSSTSSRPPKRARRLGSRSQPPNEWTPVNHASAGNVRRDSGASDVLPK